MCVESVPVLSISRWRDILRVMLVSQGISQWASDSVSESVSLRNDDFYRCCVLKYLHPPLSKYKAFTFFSGSCSYPCMSSNTVDEALKFGCWKSEAAITADSAAQNKADLQAAISSTVRSKWINQYITPIFWSKISLSIFWLVGRSVGYLVCHCFLTRQFSSRVIEIRLDNRNPKNRSRAYWSYPTSQND